jgi:hypothetical protein
MEKLPIYDVIINDDDESGVDFISLVDEPAMEMSWLKFSSDSLVEQDFSIDKDKKMLYGVFIAADKLVYRVDELRGEYYSRFKKDQIGKIIKKFNKNNFNRNINFQHGDNIVKAYVVDNFQTSDLIKADFGYDVPDGSWAGSVYIEDDEFWKDYVKTGSLKGFSVELRSRLLKADYSNFVKPESGEDKNDFMGRCVPILIGEGKDQDQAVAVCLSYWGDDYESIKEYPKGISDTAQNVLNYVEENGWGSCGTPVGKTRASQLAKGEAISIDTIKRMYSYLSRHKVDLESSKSYDDGCGKLMYDAWGGDAALSWSERFLNSDEYRLHLVKDILKSDFSEISKRKLITDILSSKKEKYYTLRLTPNSSNSDIIEYETEKKELRIKFNDGSTYLYENIEYRIFEKVWLGDAECKTSGTSPYGSWEVGDSPSVGAAIYKYLVKRGFNGRRI